MLKKISVLFSSFFVMFFVTAEASANDKGCYTPRAHQCVVSSTEWHGDRMTTTLQNRCEGRVYVRICNLMANGQDDCGQIGIYQGESGRWGTQNADNRGSSWWQYTGSHNAVNDWVCASREHDWGMAPDYGW